MSDNTEKSLPIFLLANFEEQISQRLSDDNGLSAYLQDHKLGNIPFCKKQDYENLKNSKKRGIPAAFFLAPPPQFEQEQISDAIPESFDALQIDDSAQPSMALQEDYIPSTSNFYGQGDLVLVQGHWQTEGLETQEYYGVKKAGHTTTATYTFLFVEKVVTLVPIKIKPSKANQTYQVVIDGTNLPFTISNVNFELVDCYDDSKKTTIKQDLVQGQQTTVTLPAPQGITNFDSLSVNLATCDFNYHQLPSHAIKFLPTQESLEKASKGPAIVSVNIGRIWADDQ